MRWPGETPAGQGTARFGERRDPRRACALDVAMSTIPALPKVNIRDPLPKYLQAREILIGAIRSGQLAPGVKLPSTKELSELINISLITAHKALEGLVESGWLRREVGRGTYVREDLDVVRAEQRQLHVGLLIDRQVNIDDYYHSTILNALRRAAGADTRRVEFFFHDRFDLRDRGRSEVGALCIHPPLDAQAEVERLAQRHPLIVLGGSFPNERVAYVDCDNIAGARLAAQHLVDLGHQRFLVLSGPMSLSNSRDRAEGALAALQNAGLGEGGVNVLVSRDSVVLDEATRDQLHQHLHHPQRPTAIIAGGFYLALGALQAVRYAGLGVPRDVSLVGFDDPASAPLLDPPLTTVRQPLAAMAQRAYQRLVAGLVAGHTLAEGESLQPELVVRASTAQFGR